MPDFEKLAQYIRKIRNNISKGEKDNAGIRKTCGQIEKNSEKN